MLIIRCICAAYWLLLTTLLLAPWGLLGFRPKPGQPADVGVHFLVFAVLGILVPASRLPLRRLSLAGLLVGYAIASELLQSFVPTRDTTPWDLLENLLGLAAGSAIWWVAQEYVFQKPNKRK